nr:MAG TPA: hypothetical protein [Caudoviricetes sp.]
MTSPATVWTSATRPSSCAPPLTTRTQRSRPSTSVTGSGAGPAGSTPTSPGASSASTPHTGPGSSNPSPPS